MCYTPEDIQDALKAIVRGKATGEAYIAAAQGGWAELVSGVIYKLEDKMEITTARQIITQAKKDEVYAGPMPEDDATCIKEAESVVKMAEDAWAQQVRGPEVEAILKIAAGASENGASPAAEAPSEPTGDDGEDETVQGEVDLSDFPEELTKMEPWEGYGEGRVKDVTEGINFYIEQGDDDIAELLTHIQVYEASHKKRVRILTHISTARERLGISAPTENSSAGSDTGTSGSDDGSAPAAPAEAQAEEAAEDVPQSEEVSGTAEVKGQEPAASGEAAAGSEPVDAPDDPEPTATESGDEGGSGKDEAKSPEEDHPKGSGKDPESGESSYQKLIEGVEKQLRSERLDVPTPPAEPAPDLPWSWSQVTDAQLQDFLMQYSACAYYKSYILSRDERIALHCKQAADEIRNELLIGLDKYDEHGKEKKVAVVEAEVEGDSRVRKWRRLQRKHEQFSAAAKRELDAYHKIYESLSRLETMRHNSYERGRR